MSTQRWQKVASDGLFQSRFKKLKRDTYAMPDGKKYSFDIEVKPRSVVVFVLTRTWLRIVLVEQFRPGPEKCILDLVTGVVETGETPSDAAVRETLEETGYAGRVRFLGAHYQDPYSTGIVYPCIIDNALKVSEPQPDATELIVVHELDIDCFKKRLKEGSMCQASIATGYSALDHLNFLS